MASLIVSDWIQPVADPDVLTASNTRWAGVNVALVATGAAAVVASLALYASHRPDCRQSSGLLRCGNDDAYQGYQVTQHTLGWIGGACVLTGIGLQVLTDGQPMVGIGGRF